MPDNIGSVADISEIYDYIVENAPVKIAELKKKFPNISPDLSGLLARLDRRGFLCYLDNGNIHPFKFKSVEVDD